MKKGLTDMVFVLDRSGSMCGMEADTIGGFNSMIDKQKKEKGEANVTTILFDDRFKLLHNRVDVNRIRRMTDKQYYVRGCTALLDAVGSSIQNEISIIRSLPEEQRPEKVIFVIITDGYENASREYSYKDIKKMIEFEKDKYGWEFIFMGANIDAVTEADKLGIGSSRSVRYCGDKKGTRLNYDVVCEAVTKMRHNTMSVDDASWKEAIEEDYRKRGAKK